MKTEFAFVRHGETEWNKEGKIQGLIDNPLNENGIKQAHNLGKKLKLHDSKWDIIISSPLARARETAEIIAYHLGSIPLVLDEAFVERDFGKAEGMDVSKEIFDYIIRDDIKGLEKTVHLQKRVNEACYRLVKSYPGKRILVVAHSHVIKAVLTKLSFKYTFREPMANSSVSYFTYENDSFNLIKHNVIY